MPPTPPVLPAPPAPTPRWQQAQAYEAAWWRQFEGTFNTGYLESLAGRVARAVSPVLTVGLETSVVEVGAGPVGVVAFLAAGRRVATDPLDASFEAAPAYRVLREHARAGGAEYVAAMGEALPFADATFDLYLTDNVLDHVQSPASALTEARRVLRPGGAAYVRVHVYHGWGRAVRRAMETAVIDRGHPHTFSQAGLVRTARAAGFEVVRQTRSSFAERWVADWRRGLGGSRKALVQALLGVTRADLELVLRRSE